MAAEPRVTARDPVKVVGGKDGGGRGWKKREREREKEKGKQVRGFYFKSPRTPLRHFRFVCILHQNKAFQSKEKP